MCCIFLIRFTRARARTHARIRLCFAISICAHEIYLASGECPSAIRHNISHEYQPPGHALWNIYGGNMAAGVFSSVYGERPKVQRRLPTFPQAAIFDDADSIANGYEGTNLWSDRRL